MSADKLIDCLKTIHGVRSVTIEDICTPHICVVTDSPAVAEYIDGLRVLKGLQGGETGWLRGVYRVGVGTNYPAHSAGQ